MRTTALTSQWQKESLLGLTFVIFTRDRAAGLKRLIRYLQLRTEGSRVLIFDNGETPAIAKPATLPRGISYHYDRDGFIRQHSVAAKSLTTPYAMLADDDSLPGVEGISECINTLKNNSNLVAAHGSIAEWTTRGLHNPELTARYLSADCSLHASEKLARIEQNYAKREYWSHYWYAVHPSSNLADYLKFVEEIRRTFGHGDLPEHALESACITRGQTQDVRRITLWKSPDNPTMVSSVHPIHFWNSPDFEKVAVKFMNRLAEKFELSSSQAEEFHNIMREYSYQYRMPSGLFRRFYSDFLKSFDYRVRNPLRCRRIGRDPHRGDIAKFFQAVSFCESLESQESNVVQMKDST